MVDLSFAAAPSLLPCAAALSFDTALRYMTEGLAPLGSERIDVARAANRVLAENLVATRASPARKLSAMDGYAIRDVAAGVRTAVLHLIGQAAPGNPFDGSVGQGEAVRIFTGAIVPEGADRVVPQECALLAQGDVAVPTRAGVASHIRPIGSDFTAGTILLQAGRLLDPRGVLIAVAADVASLAVRRKPSVFILATGDELRRAGSVESDGLSVPDSVSPAVSALSEIWGAEVVSSAIVRDDIGSIEHAARMAIDKADILVVTGGASVGDRDFSKAALESLGLQMLFSKVAMKPGKPVWYGRVGDCHVVGLPGNPTAALVTARLFLVPLLCALLGRAANAALPWRPLPLAGPLPAIGDRETFLCGKVELGGVSAIDRQHASGQASIAAAELLIRRVAHAPPGAIGDPVMVLDF